jgi:hypothetical protein
MRTEVLDNALDELKGLHQEMLQAEDKLEEVRGRLIRRTHDYWTARLPIETGKRCRWKPRTAFGFKHAEPRDVQIIGFNPEIVEPGKPPRVLVREITKRNHPSKHSVLAELDELTFR